VFDRLTIVAIAWLIGCTDSDDPVPDPRCADGIAPLHLYPDADGDNWGDAMSAGELLCTDSQGTNVPNNTDCADGDLMAFPGSLVFSATPVVGTGTSYDFNCDGIATPLFPNVTECRGDMAFCESLPPGWLNPPVPSCGEADPFVTACSPENKAGCRPLIDVSSTLQPCN
jgi:hypothetical protein